MDTAAARAGILALVVLLVACPVSTPVGAQVVDGDSIGPGVDRSPFVTPDNETLSTDNTTSSTENTTDNTTSTTNDTTSSTENTTDDTTSTTNDTTSTTDNTTSTTDDTTSSGTDTTNSTEDTTETVENTSESVENTTSSTTDNTTDTVENATGSTTDNTTETVENTTDSTTEAVENTTDSTTDTVENTTDSTTEAVENTTDSTTETVENTTDSTTGTAALLTEPTTDTVSSAAATTTGTTETALTGATVEGSTTVSAGGTATIETGTSGGVSTMLVETTETTGTPVASPTAAGAGSGESTPPADSGSAADAEDSWLDRAASLLPGSDAASLPSAPVGELPAGSAPAVGAGVGAAVAAYGYRRVGADPTAWRLQAEAIGHRLRARFDPCTSRLEGVGDRLGGLWDRLARYLPGAVAYRYSRYDESDPLEHDRRQAVYDAVSARPGINVTALAELTDIPVSSLRHHVKVLERERLVSVEKLDGHRRCYPLGVDNPELEAALENRATAPIIEHLRAAGPTRVGQLAEVTGRDPSTISHHVDRLADDGLIEREREGRTVRIGLVDSVRSQLQPTVGPVRAVSDD